MPAIIAAVVVAALAIGVCVSGLHTVYEYERGVVLRLGRRGPLLAPGLHLIIPFGIDRLIRVDLRSTVLRLPPHEVTTSDGVPVTLTAAVHLQVVNPLLAVTRVVDHRASSVQVAHAAVLDVASRFNLRALMTDQALVRDELSRFVDERAAAWGVQVTAIDLKDIALPAALRRAMDQRIELRGRGSLPPPRRLARSAGGAQEDDEAAS